MIDIVKLSIILKKYYLAETEWAVQNQNIPTEIWAKFSK